MKIIETFPVAQQNIKSSRQGFMLSNLSQDMTKLQNVCTPNEDSYQPGHPPSPIRVFAVRSLGS